MVTSAEAERAASAQAQRTRLARDLHDALAHTLSGLVIQLEAASGFGVRLTLPGREPTGYR